MALLLAFPSVVAAPAPATCSWRAGKQQSSDYFKSGRGKGGFEVRAFFPNPISTQQPILKEALKEPVAFVGGVFAGLLRLDLKEEPLREWVARTVEASGITTTTTSSSKREGEEEEEEQMPLQQIEIE